MFLKNFTKFDKSLLGLAIILLSLFSYLLYDDSLVMNWTAEHGPPVADIELVTNDVRQKYASDFRWKAAHQGAIHLGDSIFTGPNSSVKIKLKDQSEVEIAENSLVSFNQVGDQLTLVLKAGQIKGDKNLIKDETVEIQSQLEKISAADKIVLPKPTLLSPKAYLRKVIQINPDGSLAETPAIDVHWLYEKSNAKFEIQFSQDSRFSDTEISEVIDRKTFISPELKEGSHFIRVRESDPLNPNTKWSKVSQVELVFEKPKTTNEFSAPELLRPDFKYIIGSKNPLRIDWKRIENAASYLLEIDFNGQFQNPKKLILFENKFKIEDVEPGQYLYRVTALNTEKQMGPTSQLGRVKAVINPVVLKENQPQTYYAKSKNDKLPPTTFVVEWEPAPLAEKYIVQVSKDAEFKKPTQFETSATQVSIPINKEGIYFWRVQPLRRNKETLTAFSATSTMKYQFMPPLDTPLQVAPFNNLTLFFQSKKETPFWFEWKPVQMSQTYTIEVAQDPKFSNIVLSKTSQTTKYLTQDPLPQGTLYWRIRAEGNGRQSEWSTTRQIKVFAGRAPARER